MNPPVVVLDACTLYPAALRDVLMRLAVHRLILARWTDAIHDEWIEAVLRGRPDLSRERLQRTRELMDLHAGDSLVVGYERRMNDLKLPDADDRHVLAAAIEAEADMILTWNLRDFPEAAVSPHGIRAESPDTLLALIFDADRDGFVRVLREARLSLKQPPVSAADYVEILRAQGLTRTCMLLENSLADL
jgi:predicted nucleic acid-binding protein